MPDTDCYAYVRSYYGVPAHPKVRVRIEGREGVIVRKRSTQQYIYVRLDGERWARPYHPTDNVEYLP